MNQCNVRTTTRKCWRGKLGTYGIFRNGTAGFSVDLLARLVVFVRNDEESGIDALEAIHDGMISA
jgi:hypothetical protein